MARGTDRNVCATRSGAWLRESEVRLSPVVLADARFRRKDEGMDGNSSINDVGVDVLEARLLDVMRGYGRVAVAFSGGVDSAVVAWAARQACESAVAITAVSPSLASGELETAQDVARQIGIPHEIIRTEEFTRPGYLANAGDRCYHCKTELYESIEALKDDDRFDVIVNGANLDDVGDHRPGMVAAKEHRVRSPLIEAGLNKVAMRSIAKRHGLPVWDKPASPCLSSRIAYGVEATPERVRRVDAAEAFLKELLGIRELRVRLEANELARIELPVDQIARLSEPSMRTLVVKEFRRFGFRCVTVDLEGFRSGNLNELLPVVDLAVSRSGRTP
jgi:pyridinium-3,5-biscarboxylic acid mononucleotide sulfurtransferase